MSTSTRLGGDGPRKLGGAAATGHRPELRPGQTEVPRPERRAAARVLFEGVPGATCESVAAEVGVPVGTVRRWKSVDGWKPAVKQLPELSARAGVLADSWTKKMSDLGKPMDDEVAAAEAAREVAVDLQVDVRAQVIDRHRKEWAAPRKIAYDAIQQAQVQKDVAGAFERAKLAKITSETLTLIQAGECRAFGITAEGRGADARTVVVVDRDDAAPAAPQVPTPGGPDLLDAAGSLPVSPTEGTDTTPDEESF